MEEIRLKVENAFPVDLGKGIIRLDSETYRALKFSQGDTVEIMGKKRPRQKFVDLTDLSGIGIL